MNIKERLERARERAKKRLLVVAQSGKTSDEYAYALADAGVIMADAIEAVLAEMGEVVEGYVWADHKGLYGDPELWPSAPFFQQKKGGTSPATLIIRTQEETDGPRVP